MSKSAIYTVLATDTPIVTDGIVPLGAIVRRFGCNVNLDGNAITLLGKGYFKITASLTVSPTAAGDAIITAQKNGAEITGATASGAATAAGDPVNLSIVALVRNLCDCDSSLITLLYGGADATLNNVALTVEKL